MKRIAGAFLVVWLAPGSRIASSEEIPDLPSFFVAPIRTDVHRAVVATNASAYAVIDSSSVHADGKLDNARLNEAQFTTELTKSAAANPSRLKLVLRYQLGPVEVAQGTKTALRNSLEELGRAAGFEAVSTTEMYTSADWSDTFAAVYKFQEIEGASEPIVDDDLSKVYPLRTRLSKFAIGSADCVVEIKRPIDGRNRDLSEELRESIKRNVESIGLDRDRSAVMYRVLSTDAGRELVDQLFDNRGPVKIPPNLPPALLPEWAEKAAQYKPSPALDLAFELGFDRIICSHAPCGGAPEKLVGMPAPNFELTTLDGEELELSAYLQGRPAIVSFWGVACGPCRREAPHLTAMHAKYGANFVIVAVNAYNESREVISRFADQQKLTHPIVLNGRNVAEDLFHVAAYPTTFWIDQDGLVADYDIDFDSAAALERRINQMLNPL